MEWIKLGSKLERKSKRPINFMEVFQIKKDKK